MDATLTKKIENDKIWPFPRIKRGVGPTIFPRRKLLPANSSIVYSSYEEAKKVLDKQEIKGKIIKFRNTSKDLYEEILDDKYYETEEEANLVKEQLEMDEEDFQVIASVQDVCFSEKKMRSVKMFFISERERNVYIKMLEKKGYILESILLEEEPKKEEFTYSCIYEDFNSAKDALNLLENNYQSLGKITVLPSGLYEISLQAVRNSKDKLYILDAIVLKSEEKHCFEVFIERIQKGYDYVIEYI